MDRLYPKHTYSTVIRIDVSMCEGVREIPSMVSDTKGSPPQTDGTDGAF